MKVTVNPKLCRGYGNCVAAAPDVYDLEDDIATVLLPEPDEALHADARQGAAMCPVSAIEIVED
jgi:ferredoxin